MVISPCCALNFKYRSNNNSLVSISKQFITMSEASLPLTIYEEVLNEDTSLDLSSQHLQSLPEIKNDLLCMIYLQGNSLTELPEDFFPSLPSLMYLDLRDNCLRELPKSIKNHPSLTHLLLQNNCLTFLPDELGTVKLKVLQISENPLEYPPKEIISQGVTKTLKFLHDQYIANLCKDSAKESEAQNPENDDSQEENTYNSVELKQNSAKNDLSVNVKEKSSEEAVETYYYSKMKGKCPKLDKSRVRSIGPYTQSSKYVKTPTVAGGKKVQDEKIRLAYLRQMALKKHKELLASREKIIQGRKNLEALKNWRREYRYKQCFADPSLPEPSFPYGTSPEYMTLLTREDLEKDLPDKYRKNILRRSKPTMPRKPKDLQLALKIKQLFENLEKIDLNKGGMTPRTEQRVLLDEIQKISEIKQKLHELSVTNQHSLGSN